jgi:HAD superfamily hydrolase (TIGR01509 family)
MAGQELRGVMFDVDGTLVDTTYLHTICWAEAFRQGGHRLLMRDIHRGIGLGASELLDHLLGSGRDRSADDTLQAAHRTLYAEYWERLQPTPGAADLLRRCSRSGLAVLLASSAKKDELAALTDALDADDSITVATSSSDAKVGKPDPGILKVALDRAGLAAEDVVMVGDSVWDAAAAAPLGIEFIGLTCGGLDPAELRAAGAVEIYPHPQALLDAFGTSRLAASVKPVGQTNSSAPPVRS